MKYFIPLLFFLGFTCSVHAASEEINLQSIMVISKMTGICGVMNQMASFQGATQMAGGTEFFARFWRTEFARLGKTEENFMQDCKKSIEHYDRFYKELEKL